MATKAMERLDSLCKEIRTTVACTATVRIGVPYEEILNEAEKVGPDLIVLGGKGVSALARMVLGTTASQVVRFAQCSVLVARHSPDQSPPEPAQTVH
jgi:nucleotide-binding universal stress UspA family protein